MGPSGAGKDTLLHYARLRLEAAPVAFAHRYITRPRGPGEDHVELTAREWERRRACGCFALHWDSHEQRYGIGIEIIAWLSRGLSVIVNGSRGAIGEAAARWPEVVPILVTASPAIRARRLATRGRESDRAIEQRLARSSLVADPPGAVVIDNDHSLQTAGDALVCAVLDRLPGAR
jgi:ribose 1,5-bisphosphokinase